MTEQKYSILENIKKDWPLILFFIISIGFAFFAYPHLPDRVPTHWNIHGEVDGWSSKEFGAFFFPLFALGIWLLLIVIPLVDPKKANYQHFISAYKWIRWAIVTFMLTLGPVTLLVPLGYNINIGKVVTIGVSLLFILLGNFFGKIKHNYFLGIRTPWTLANEEVWRRTHRMAGFLWVGAGILGVISAFIPPQIGFWVFMLAILGSTAITFVYSFLLFNKITNK